MNDQRSLPEALLRPAGRVLNAALEADPAATRALEELSGRCVAVHVSDLDLVVVAHIEGHRIELGGPVETPDAEVAGTLPQLAAAGRSGSPKGLQVSGDAELVHGLSRAMARLPAAAWERFARTIGDVPARGLERLGSGLASLFRDTRERLSGSLADYLHYEVRAVPSRHELEGFMSAVDRTRDDVERLAKRIERMERR